MNKQRLQWTLFAVSMCAAIVNSFLEKGVIVNYIVLISSMIYLLVGWLLPLIVDDKQSIINELIGFIYSTVLFANFMSATELPMAKSLVIFGDVLAIGLLIYVGVNRKKVRRSIVIQSIILFLVSPIPLWL